MRKVRKTELISISVGVLGIIVAIVAISPNDWVMNLNIWRTSFWALGSYIVTFVFGTGLSSFFCWMIVRRKFKDKIKFVDNDIYSKEFNKLLKFGNYPVIKIFGYTGEVVTNDLLKYMDRYHQGVELRMLHRNWNVERADENEHNEIIKNRGLRPWKKADAIEKMATEEKAVALKINIKYYSHHPIIKGAIFCDVNGLPIIAFINFQKWVSFPPNGGSVFKSVPSDMLVIETGSNKDMLDRINSQFEYEWCYGREKCEIEQESVSVIVKKKVK